MTQVPRTPKCKTGSVLIPTNSAVVVCPMARYAGQRSFGMPSTVMRGGRLVILGGLIK